jgi:hypothetical protein
MIPAPHASKSTPASGATKATLIKEPRLKIIHQRDVIPNRAESPVRNPLFAFAVTDRALLPAAFDFVFDSEEHDGRAGKHNRSYENSFTLSEIDGIGI